MKARIDGAGDKPTVSQVALIRPLAGFCGGLAVLTIFWPDWIEALTGYDGRGAHRDSPLVIRAVLALAARPRTAAPSLKAIWSPYLPKAA
jgi:hypothetical protein